MDNYQIAKASTVGNINIEDRLPQTQTGRATWKTDGKNGDIYSITANHKDLEKCPSATTTESFVAHERHFLLKCKNGDIYSITANHKDLEKCPSATTTESFVAHERHFLLKCMKIATLDMICMFLGELVGTTFLLLFGCMGSVNWTGTEQPQFIGGFIFGLTVLSIIQCFGTISGAHLNPAVTLCAVIYRTLSIPMAIVYVIAQFAGAVMGFGLLILLTPSEIFRPEGTVGAGVCSTVPRAELNGIQVFVYEFCATTVLILLCCASWDPRNAKQQDSVAIKFGFAVAVLSITVGPATGNSMNPARTFGPALLNNDWDMHWIYWMAPMSASLITTLIYKALFFRNVSEDKKDS